MAYNPGAGGGGAPPHYPHIVQAEAVPYSTNAYGQSQPPPYSANDPNYYDQKLPPVSPGYQPPMMQVQGVAVQSYPSGQPQGVPPPYQQQLQQQPYPHPPQSPTTVVMVQAPVSQTLTRTHEPTQFQCNSCGYQGLTATRYEYGPTAWLSCLAFVCLGCYPCGILPFCIRGFQDCHHTCPNCQQYLGK